VSSSYDECGKLEEPERNIGVACDELRALLMFQLFALCLHVQTKRDTTDGQTDRQTDRQTEKLTVVLTEELLTVWSTD